MSSNNSRASAAEVEALGVCRDFADRRVVGDLTMSVPAGVIHGLLGPNGAGKTTILRMVAGLTAPTAGTVTIGGRNPTERAVRALIGWVPASERSFYLRLSGSQNLTFFGQLHGMSRQESRTKAERWIGLVGLADTGPRPVRLYSHGMVKRLVVARALMCDPLVLVVDEATHDLDPLGRDDIQRLVREAADNGASVLWATQRITELRGFADSVTVLGAGETRFSGSVEELAGHGGSQSYRIRFDSAFPYDSAELSWGRIQRLEGSELWRLVVPEELTLTDAFEELAALGLRVTSCSEETADVERAFLRLTAPRHAAP